VTAVELVAGLRARERSCTEVAGSCLAAIADDSLRAWVAHDPDRLLARAAELDRLTAQERERLALYGLPIGVKDAFDTIDLPTAYGSEIYRGHQPDRDAEAVRRLRAAGAMVVGKTKCTEFSWMAPADTLNPLDRSRTPGGSSSGSAAAVAAGTVPVATGAQTAGSINRPASYCGVLGYKPTFGALPRGGVMPLAGSLDTVGLLARSVEDLLLTVTALASPDPLAPTNRPSQPSGLDGDALGDRAPRLALVRTPYWSAVEPAAQSAIEAAAAAAERAGATVEEAEPDAELKSLTEAHRTIQWVEGAATLGPELRRVPELLSDELRSALHEGAAIPLGRYLEAQRTARVRSGPVHDVLARFDGVLTPSATGVPPVGLEFTGDSLFCRAWTLIGAPCVSVPIAWTAGGLPVSVQVVGGRMRDRRALETAAWLMRSVGS
jgi:Asp-tRNA(Asn)/Glu-tRNA(Gln) amidotransferase A subunit family amidase